jgi:nucleotide-binding universal stress UspA family protein
MQPIRTILHPTDFSDASADAFVHALRIAVAAKAMLYILHVASGRDDDVMAFPHVRDTLARWGLVDAQDPPQAVEAKLGLRIAKVDLQPQAPEDGVRRFIADHPPELMVVATEARHGAARWLHGSLAEKIARATTAPTLFVPAKARPFVDPMRGGVRLHHVLIPIHHKPKPAAAVGFAMRLAHMIAGPGAEERLMHVGKEAPRIARHDAPGRVLPVALRQADDVVAAIVEAANDWPADLIAMATAGHRNVLDMMRGSTTEQVLRQAPCPVLAVPVA